MVFDWKQKVKEIIRGGMTSEERNLYDTTRQQQEQKIKLEEQKERDNEIRAKARRDAKNKGFLGELFK